MSARPPSTLNRRRLREAGFLSPLTKKGLSAWINVAPPDLYRKQTNFHYQGHRLLGVFILVEGALRLESTIQQGLQTMLIKSPVLVGWANVFFGVPSPYSLIVFPNSKVSFLPRTLVQQMGPTVSSPVPGNNGSSCKLR